MVLVLSIAALTGLAMLTLGLRGRRVDDHPLCRKCKFDLIGVYSGPSGPDMPGPTPARKCPECGAEFTRRRAIVMGHRRRDRARIGVGLVLLLGALSYSGYEGWRWAHFFDWNTVKPVSWLAQEARGNDLAAGQRAVDELLRRLQLEKLSSDQVHTLLQDALAAQPSASPVWDSWAEFFSTAWERELVNEDELKQYLRNGVRPTLKCPPQVTQGEPLKIEAGYNYGNFGMSPPGLLVQLIQVRAQVDGQELPLSAFVDPDFRFGGIIEAGSGSNGWPYVAGLGLRPGPRHLTVSMQVGIYDVTDNGAATSDEPFVVVDNTSEFDVDVDPVEGVRFVTDVPGRTVEDIERDLRSHIEATIRAPAPGEHIHGSFVLIQTRPGPVDFVFSVNVVRKHRSRNTGDMYIANSARSDVPADLPRGIGDWADVKAGDVVDIVLAPAPERARSLGFTEIWGRELVLKDIKVQPDSAR